MGSQTMPGKGSHEKKWAPTRWATLCSRSYSYNLRWAFRFKARGHLWWAKLRILQFKESVKRPQQPPPMKAGRTSSVVGFRKKNFFKVCLRIDCTWSAQRRHIKYPWNCWLSFRNKTKRTSLLWEIFYLCINSWIREGTNFLLMLLMRKQH